MNMLWFRSDSVNKNLAKKKFIIQVILYLETTLLSFVGNSTLTPRTFDESIQLSTPDNYLYGIIM